MIWLKDGVNFRLVNLALLSEGMNSKSLFFFFSLIVELNELQEDFVNATTGHVTYVAAQTSLFECL